MKKALVIVAILGMVAVANAEMRLFFTASTVSGFIPGTTTVAPGLTNASSTWNHVSFAITSNDTVPTYTDNKDYSSTTATARFRIAAANFPTYNGAVPAIDPDGVDGIAGNADDEFVYMWAQFYHETAPKLRSWKPGVTLGGDPNIPVNATWYKQDNMGGSPAAKRWDGVSTEVDNYATFRNNPQYLVAVTTAGVPNGGLTENEDVDENGYPDTYGTPDAWNLYKSDVAVANGPYTYFDDGIHTRIALVGSFQPDEGRPGAYTVSQYADVDLNGIIVTPVTTGFTVTPEPASMLLIALAGLLIRRR